MALTSGPSTSFSYYSSSSSSIRDPVRVRTSSTSHPRTSVTTEKRGCYATIAEIASPAPPVSIEFEIPHTTIDLFLRSEVFSLVRRDTPPAHLVLNDVIPAAIPAIRLYFETVGKHIKIDYSPTTRKLIVTCASREHHFMSNFGPEIMELVNSNDKSFSGNDPEYKIVENGDCGIPLGGDKHGRQPDGGLRLLNRELHPPFLVWEVLDSQPLSQMIEKISHYFTHSQGRIRIVIVIQIIRQRPYTNPKRNRRPLSIGDESDSRRSPLLHMTNEPETGEQDLPQLPPPGRLIQGFYWVYKHGRNAANKRVIQCPIKQQEFYPTPPVGILKLTWADILTTVPPLLSAKSLDIPFTILHDRFRELVGVSLRPEEADELEPDNDWDLSSFPGIECADDRSDPVSEAVASDAGSDGSFHGVEDPLQEGATLRRSARIAHGQVDVI